MNTKTWIPLACAIGLGLVAAFVAQRSMHNKAQASTQQAVTIAVAKADIPPGTALTADNIITAPIPGNTAPAGSFTSPNELVGRVTAAPMLPGQPFQTTLLAAQGVPAGLAALVPAGMRAVTIDVSESGAMAGLLIPGSRVDVVATNVNRDHPEKTATYTFVQNVAVLAVGQKLGTPKADGDKDVPIYRTVTLLATPHDSEALDLALTMTRVRLVLRATGDQTALTHDGVNAVEVCHLDADTKDTVPPTAVTPSVIAPTAVAAATPPATQPATTERPSIFTSSAPAPAPTRTMTLILGSEEHQLAIPDPTANTATAAAPAPAESTGTPSGLGATDASPR
jgi:pilus assembly protein CpaB